MRRLSLLPALLCAALASAAADKAGDQPIAVAFKLEPKKVHEECTRLEAGQSRRWHWKSDAPVDFNIHYHRGEDVFYPVKRDGMRGDGGTFTAKSGEDYCWMWTARNAPTKVDGRIEKK
jgi:hypothetical protein